MAADLDLDQNIDTGLARLQQQCVGGAGGAPLILVEELSATASELAHR